MTLPSLTQAAQPPPGYVFCIEPSCPAVIWKPGHAHPRCTTHQRLRAVLGGR